MKLSVASLEERIERLQKELEERKMKEREEVLFRVQEAVANYGLTPEEVFFGAGKVKKRVLSEKELKRQVARRRKVTGAKTLLPRYGDSEGNTWAGGGSIPRWMRRHLEAGKKKEDFRLSEFDRRAA